MKTTIRRSTLILPVNIRRFVERAYARGADAIVLDLEDAVPPAEKVAARKLLKESVPLVARGGAEVQVRVNNVPELLEGDLTAAVCAGVDGITLPKAESAEQLRHVDALLAHLERERGVAPGRTRLSLIVETARGVLDVEQVAAASPRVVTMSVGPEDYCLELGIEPSADGVELQYAVSRLVTVCKALRIQACGLLGCIGDFRNLAAFEAAAVRGRALGCEGAACIHPEQVAVLNRVFTPSAEKIEDARRVIEAFQEGLRRGTASVNLDGRMIDIPIYRRAEVLFERACAIEEAERRKREALARLT